MIRKIFSLLLCSLLCFTFFPGASFASRDLSYAESLALDLKNLGLFQGVSDTDFALKRKIFKVITLSQTFLHGPIAMLGSHIKKV